MNRVSNDEKARPNTMDEATGPNNRDLPPSPAASENRPAMVVEVVMMMGTTRLLAA